MRRLTISMNKKQNKRSARITPRKIHIVKGARGLTAQAGLIPVVKFLRKQGLIQLIKETVHHQRGATALYDAVDAIFLPLVAIIGGARSIRAIVTVWFDTILCRAAGWLNIPDETTFGRLFRTFSQRYINDLEVLTHRLRGKIWRKALRAGKSKIAASSCMVIDVDSTEKTVYGSQEGAAKGYNPRAGPCHIIPCLSSVLRPRRFFRVGCDAAMPIPVTESSSLPNSFWRIFPTELAFCFAGTVDFFVELCLIFWIREDMVT